MKRIIYLLTLLLLTITVGAQNFNITNLLKENPKRAYGNDCPYIIQDTELTPSPEGYKPFYISHYARHGSRYYWSDKLYKELDTLLTVASQKQVLTDEGEAFRQRFMDVKQELFTGCTELTQLGWEQHQAIARLMYNDFPEVFLHGGNVLAIASLSGRCVISMSAFCQELTQCNPAIEIREQSSRFTLDGVVPSDHNNPLRRKFPRVMPRFINHRDLFHEPADIRPAIVKRLVTSTEGLPYEDNRIADKLIDLYTSLPNIGHEGLMGNLITDDEIVSRWEASNLGSYAWVFGPQYEAIPILQDIMRKANAVIYDEIDRVADLRFGHDTCIGPLTVLMGINGADRDPEDPNQVKYYYQNWQTCKASNIQLVFYRSDNSQDDILVKCLLNGNEATLPVPTVTAPYYKWSDFCRYYNEKIEPIISSE